MKKGLILFFILSINIVYSQSSKNIRNTNTFELQCWKNILKQLDKATVIIAIKNGFDNWDERNQGRKLMVAYYRDSSSQWFYKIILIDLKKRKWQESENMRVHLFFEKYLNTNLDELKSTFKERCEAKREQASWGKALEFYYQDSTDKFINDYYSVGSGVNDLIVDAPLIFNMYSYAMNMSFNIKFKNKYKIEEKYYY